MSDPELIGLPGHEVMRIGPPVDVKDLIARDEILDLMVQSVERYLRTVPADYGVCPGYPNEPRHNRAHANKLARHAKRPNGRPRHR